MRAKTKTGEMEKIGHARVSNATEAERDDWLWMVDSDPAFYLKQQEGPRSRGVGRS